MKSFRKLPQRSRWFRSDVAVGVKDSVWSKCGETKEFVKRLDWWHEKKRKVKEIFKVLTLSNLKNTVDIMQN